MNTDRVQAFSDGVFAILITILVLNFKIPAYSSGNLSAAFFRQWPDFFAYLMTFIYIGILWLFHHDLFERIKTTTIRLNILNLLSIFLTTLLSYSMSMLSKSLYEGNFADIRFATGFYSLLALGISLSYYMIYRYITGSAGILCSPDSLLLFRKIAHYPLISIAIYALSLIFSQLNVYAGLVFLLVGISFHGFAYLLSSKSKSL